MPLPLPSSDSSGISAGSPGSSSLPQPPAAGPTNAPLHPPTGPPTSPPAATVSCYRHDDRVGGRQCTRCGKHACPDCLVSASVGSHCLECAKAARPDLKTRARFWQASQPALVAYALIAVNVAVFIGLGLYYDFAGMLSGSRTDAHLEFGLNTFFIDGQPGTYTLSTGERKLTEGNQWYRLVTSGFMHFGLIHLGLNMFFLFLLGNEMEPMLGRVKFGLLYGASLFGGSAGVVLIDQGSITAGASGAVFGLLGGYAIGIWRHGINVFNTQIGSLLMVNLFITFLVRNISIGGHIGGLVAGGICGFVMLAPGYKGVPAWAKFATPVAVALVAVAVSIAAAAA